MPESSPSFALSLCSGGVAGLTVDIALYPLDTIKTRLQSAQGFLKSGGFRGVYKGLSAAAVGSAPGAALFFCSYETCKSVLRPEASKLPAPVVHMTSACIGEVVACMVRVPTEVVKQRMQTGMHSSIGATITSTIEREGIKGLYSGFGITILREIPFSLIQFPLYEHLKQRISIHFKNGSPCASHESAMCGSFAGGVAAALTTPLDVLKTRLMLGADKQGVPYKSASDTLARLVVEGSADGAGSKGVARLLFSGVQPRVMWISIGGFVFFGAYEQAKKTLGFLIR